MTAASIPIARNTKKSESLQNTQNYSIITNFTLEEEMVMNLLHCKISFYLQGYIFSFREKHLQNQRGMEEGGLENAVTPRSQQHAETILFQA